MQRPYTTRKDKTDFELPVAGTDIGWKRTHASVRDSLKSLAKDLPEVPENTTFTRSDVSVPSPWASLISFDIILKNRENDFGALQTRAVNEWRSLLTIIALKDLFGLRFGKEEIDLTQSNGNEADKAFFSNILELKPEKSLFKNENCWNKFVFLTLEDNVIGVFSNSTLISSNYSYEENLATKKLQEIGIMDKELSFINPVSMIKNDLSLSLYLSAWLETLKRNIPEIPEDDSIGTIIDEFIDEIKESYIGDMVTYNELANNDFIEFEFDYAEDEPANASELLWNIKIKKMDLSMPQIQNKIKLGKVQKPTFVLEGLGKDLVNLTKVLGEKCIKPVGTFLDNTSVFLDTMTLIKIKVENENVKKAYEDGFGVCSIEEKNEEGEIVVNKYSYILPLTDSVLKSLSANTVRQIAKITETDENIIVSLTMNLEDGTPCELKKVYNKLNCNKIYNNVLPTIAVWPYATISNRANVNIWKDYYVFSAQKKIEKKYTTKVRCDGQENELNYNEMTRINKSFVRKVAQTEKIPTHLSIYENDYDFQGNLIKEHSLGVILLKEPANYDVVENRKYVIGLDFGTTSTTAFCKRDDGISEDKYKFIKLGQLVERKNDDAISIPTSATNSDFEEGTFIGSNDDGCYLAYENETVSIDVQEPKASFVPKTYPKRRAYVSLYKQNTEDSVSGVDNNFPLKYGNILFDQTMIGTVSSDDLIRNLKWGNDGKTQRALTGYLGQMIKALTFTLAKEGAESITWRFSYPTALTDRERNQYRNMTEVLVNKVNNLSGINSSIDDTNAFCPESIASARFLDQYPETYMCIDIGGGSSDVSMWKKNFSSGKMENILQFSIPLASRKIFLPGIADAIVNTKEVVEKKGTYQQNDVQKGICALLRNKLSIDMEKTYDDVLSQLKEIQRLDDAYKPMLDFSYVIEPLLQSNGKQMQEIMNMDENVSTKFERFLLTGFWGILYYIAMSLYIHKDKLKDTNMISVNLAGNGAMLYDWIRVSYGKRLEDAFGEVLNKTLERTNNEISVRFDFYPKNLKTEAAVGLLKLDENDEICIENLLENNTLIAGANCIYKYKSTELCNKYTCLHVNGSADEYVDRIMDVVIENPENDLKEFVEILNRVVFNSDKKLNLDLDAVEKEYREKNDVREPLKRNIASAIQRSTTVTPPFIFEIEALLRTILGY